MHVTGGKNKSFNDLNVKMKFSESRADSSSLILKIPKTTSKLNLSCFLQLQHQLLGPLQQEHKSTHERHRDANQKRILVSRTQRVEWKLSQLTNVAAQARTSQAKANLAVDDQRFDRKQRKKPAGAKHGASKARANLQGASTQQKLQRTRNEWN